MQGLVVLLILMALAGPSDELPPSPWPPEPPPLPPDEGGVVPAVLDIPPEGEEPPFDAVIPPIFEAEEVVPPDGMTDAQWLAAIDGIVSEIPTQEKFWAVKQGSSASALATALLPSSANTAANRVRLIKCMTSVPWNNEHYAADAGRGTWGTLFDVAGVNLSSAWMPRHPSAMQALANRQNPLRGVDDQGRQIGTGGYYGLLWIPKFTATPTTLICNGPANNPPGWLMGRLQG